MKEETGGMKVSFHRRGSETAVLLTPKPRPGAVAYIDLPGERKWWKR